jgi:hypothetical protein
MIWKGSHTMNSSNLAVKACRELLARRRNTGILNYMLIVGAILLIILIVTFAITRLLSFESDETPLVGLDLGYVVRLFLGVALLTAGLVAFILRRFARVRAQKDVLDWAPFSVYGKPQAVIAETQAELQRKSDIIGRFYFGATRLVEPDPFNLWKYEDLVLVYYDADEEALTLKCELQDDTNLSTDEQTGQMLINEIKTRAPWITTDEIGELRRTWSRDRNQIIAQVTQRRKVLTA